MAIVLFVLCTTITSRNLAQCSSHFCNHGPGSQISACRRPVLAESLIADRRLRWCVIR